MGSYMEIDEYEKMRSTHPPNIKRESKEMNKPISPIDLVEPDDAPTVSSEGESFHQFVFSYR